MSSLELEAYSAAISAFDVGYQWQNPGVLWAAMAVLAGEHSGSAACSGMQFATKHSQDKPSACRKKLEARADLGIQRKQSRGERINMSF